MTHRCVTPCSPSPLVHHSAVHSSYRSTAVYSCSQPYFYILPVIQPVKPRRKSASSQLLFYRQRFSLVVTFTSGQPPFFSASSVYLVLASRLTSLSQLIILYRHTRYNSSYSVEHLVCKVVIPRSAVCCLDIISSISLGIQLNISILQ